MRVAAAGGGIAGLTAAIALAARGFDIDLYERAPVLEEIGAGIQLSPNATAVLQRLGVMDELSGRLSEPETLVIRDAGRGNILAKMPLGRTARERYGAPYCTLHRADLQAALLAVLRRHPTVALHLGAELRDVRAGEAEVKFTAGGVERHADVLVAADGVRSTVRTDYFHHRGPAPMGHTAWRAILAAADLGDRISSDEVGLWLAPHAHLVHYPISSGSTFNIVLIGAPNAEPPLSAFGGAARAILECVREWTHSPLVAVDASRSWNKGRVVLIGDAAHAMAPSAAQGGAQAIEDAWVLAGQLAGGTLDPATALASFAKLRQPRVRRVANVATRNLHLYEHSGILAAARNLTLTVLPATLILHRFDWLFGWRPE